jgi:hypothetical protein
MHRSVPLALVALLAVSACSKPATKGAAGASASATPAAASAPVGNACDRKIIVAADVAPLFDEPITKEETLAGDAQTCTFTTTGFSLVHISIRPGLGDTSVDLVQSGKTNQTVTPLAGVGERAVWDPLLKEVEATKGNTLCDISFIGPATSKATSDKVGALCNKIFAAS